MSDSRLAKIEEHHGCHAFEARNAITSLEAAGLLVIDPDDEATIERVAQAICRSQDMEGELVCWNAYRTAWMNDARSALAAARAAS